MRGFWRTGRPASKPGASQAGADDGSDPQRSEPDLIEGLVRERSFYDLFDSRGSAQEEDPDS